MARRIDSDASVRIRLTPPPGWDETFFELTLEDLVDAITEAQKSRRKHTEKVYTIETPRRRITVTIASEPM